MAAPARPPRSPPPGFSAAGAALCSSMQNMLLQAAHDGDLRLLKSTPRFPAPQLEFWSPRVSLVRALDRGWGRLREAVEAARAEGGVWALLLAAVNEQLEVCSYLVEGLRVDVNAADDEGRTPLVYAVMSENAAVVKYLLDHGADPGKADDDGLTPLHSAAGQGAYVDPVAPECGTPLHLAVKQKQVDAVKVLLDHKADCNKTYMIFGLYGMTPLFHAINVSSVKIVKLLVEAGADVSSDCIETAILDSAMGNDDSAECINFLLEAGASCKAPDDAKHMNKRKLNTLKSLGSKAVEKKDYFSASVFYSQAMHFAPYDATLFSNKSLCMLRMGDGEQALLDALECREMRPDWPKACYRQGEALMLLKDYKSACEALFDGFKLDPENAEIEHALREAMEALKKSKGTTAK